jgi:hypothetical protein
MVSAPADRFELFEDYVDESLTLAATRYYVDRLKSFLRANVAVPAQAQGHTSAQPPAISVPATTGYKLGPGQLLHWTQAGMRETHKQYGRLVAEIARLETKPVVILLYNPSCYEIYRDILVDRQPEYDQVSEFQMEAQKAFAAANGWQFIDLTAPLRKKLERSKSWIYGKNDSTHWSHQGTAIVAEVMTEELKRVMAQ